MLHIKGQQGVHVLRGVDGVLDGRVLIYRGLWFGSSGFGCRGSAAPFVLTVFLAVYLWGIVDEKESVHGILSGIAGGCTGDLSGVHT